MNTRNVNANDTRQQKVDSAKDMIEAMGELFIKERFTSACSDECELSGARIERWTESSFNRLIIEPDLIDRELLSIDRLKSDLMYLHKLVDTNPEGFKGLVDALDDLELLRERGSKLGLVESKFLEGNGGWGWLIVIPLVLVLVGCRDGGSPPSGVGNGKCWNKGSEGYHCTRKPHQGGRHKNGGRSWN